MRDFMDFFQIHKTINQEIEDVLLGIVQSPEGETGCAMRRFSVAQITSKWKDGERGMIFILGEYCHVILAENLKPHNFQLQSPVLSLSPNSL